MTGTLLVFDPQRWPRRELVGRAAGILFACALLAGKALQWQSFPGSYEALRDYYLQFGYSHRQAAALWLLRAAVWVLETGIAAGYLAAFVTRLPAKGVAKGFMETAFPLMVAGLPIAITGSPYTLPQLVPAGGVLHVPLLVLTFLFLVIGEGLNLNGLLALRRSFSMMPESRALVTAGPFSRLRHPLYVGHFVAFLGYTLLHWSAAVVIAYGLFVAGQIIRARMEEAKLTASFPEYAAYRKRVPAFFPGFPVLANGVFLTAIVAGLPFCSGAKDFLGAGLLPRGASWALAGLLPLYGALTLGLCLASRRLEELIKDDGRTQWDDDPFHRRFHDLLIIGPFALASILSRFLPWPLDAAGAAITAVETAAIILLCAELAARTIRRTSRWSVWLRLAGLTLVFAPFRPQANLWDLASAGLAAALSLAMLPRESAKVRL